MYSSEKYLKPNLERESHQLFICWKVRETFT